MSYRLEIEIPGLPETTNEVLAMGLRPRLRQKKYWKQVVFLLTRGKVPPKPLSTAKLTLIRNSASRPDPDGLTSTFKHVIDGLVIAGVLSDDRHENIGFPDYQWGKAPRGKGFCRVVVEEVCT